MLRLRPFVGLIRPLRKQCICRPSACYGTVISRQSFPHSLTTLRITAQPFSTTPTPSFRKQPNNDYELEELTPEELAELFPEEENDTDLSDPPSDDWYVDEAYKSDDDFVPLWQRTAPSPPPSTVTPTSTISSILQSLERQQIANVRVIDVRNKCDWTDYMVIGETDRGVRYLGSVAQELSKTLKRAHREQGIPHVEGVDDESPWVLVDVGNFVVHLFTPEARREYDLDTLWGGDADAVIDRLEKHDA
ncbi:hypothetical protein BZG36_04061 [Bifiguratus adelaidae]|uniref:Ribosomal silencing factor RsfS n=1 Tax=Bifiguratus adelaidae TaxID=1938954 RepID=A0A261XWF3_9FUNG|nr:hypothetical protein BZG36_04061 [Bifiguratus adelaidae]